MKPTPRAMLVLMLVISGCGSPTMDSDAAVDAAIVAPDAASRDAGASDARVLDAGASDAGVTDAGADAAATLDDAGALDSAVALDDAGSDAGSDAGPTGSALVIVGSATTPALMSAFFRGGAWSAPTASGVGAHNADDGGGAAVLGDGRAIAVLSGGALTTVQSALWDGASWSAHATPDMQGRVSVPIAVPAGALVAGLPAQSSGALSVASLDATTSTWSAFSGTGTAVADYFTRPAIADGVTDAPLALAADLSSYVWAQRVAGVWAGGQVPGVVPPAATGSAPGRSIAAVAIPGTDRFLVALAAAGGELVVLEFSGGTWSAPQSLATDLLAVGGSRQNIAMIALPDARVVLAYHTSTDGIGGAIYGGAGWTALPPIASAMLAPYSSAFSIAPGIEPGVLVEAVFLRGGFDRAFHARLGAGASGTWSALTPIEGTDHWASVHAATIP